MAGWMVALALATAPVQATPAPAPAPTAQDAKDAAAMSSALKLMNARQHDAALAMLDPLLAELDRRFAAEKRQIYCGFGMAETIAYMTIAAAAKRDAVAVQPIRCDALFAKGFILADARRFAEARPYLERAVSMAPSHAHYLNELGYVLQQERNWQGSHDIFARAAEATGLSDPDRVTAERTRAWRGMSFALIELERWDEAKAVLDKCLALDPNDAKAKNELQYIAENRNKRI